MPQSDPPQAENPAKQDSFLSYRKESVKVFSYKIKIIMCRVCPSEARVLAQEVKY